MPEFPRYESKGTLTTQQPSFLAAESTEGKITEKIGEAAGAVGTQAGKLLEAYKSTQKTVALTNNKSDILDIQQRAMGEVDPKKWKAYQSEIEKARIKHGEGLGALASKELNLDSKVASIQIDNIFQKKNLELDTIATKRAIELEVNNPAPGSLPKIKALLNEKVAAGLIDPSVAYAEEVKANANLGVNRISKDLYLAQTPEEVDAVTQGITSGAYEQGGVTIEPDKKKNLLDIAERARTNTEKRIQAQATEAMVQNRMEVITGLASGKLQFDSVDLTNISEYDPQLATVLTKVKDFMVNYNPKLTPQEQSLSSAGLMTVPQIMNMKSYAKSITDLFLKDDNKTLSEFVLREFDKKGDGLTSSIKLAAFANLAFLKSKVNNQQTTQDSEASGKYNAIKAGIKFLQTTNPVFSPKAIGDFIVKNYLSGSSSKEQVMQEAKTVLQDEVLNRYKAVAKLPSLPNKIVDGEASVEDLHSGLNDLEGESYSGDYGDQDRSE